MSNSVATIVEIVAIFCQRIGCGNGGYGAINKKMESSSINRALLLISSHPNQGEKEVFSLVVFSSPLFFLLEKK